MSTPNANRWRELAAMFLMSAATLGSQIAWTRIFSFMIWYHFAFLVISTAMLGFSVGGLILHLRPQLLERKELPPAAALGFCIASPLSLLTVCNLPFDGGVLDSLRNFGLFVLLIVVVAAAFMTAGLFTSAMIARKPEAVGSMYAANLLGSGVGCALAVPLLDRVLPASSVLAFALLAWLACLLIEDTWPFLRGGGQTADRTASAVAETDENIAEELEIGREAHERYPRSGGTAVARDTRARALMFLTLVGLCSGFAISLRPMAAPFYMRSTKPFPGLSKQRILTRMSNTIATVDMFRAEDLTGLWGLSDQRYTHDTHGRPLPERVGFCIDGWALTFGYHAADGDIVAEPVFDYLPASLLYSVVQPRSALVIGAGGGIDVISALRSGVQTVDAVEINPITMQLSRALGDYNDHIFERPGVRALIGEGRSFVAASGERRWDVIQLSGVDTLAASQAGAFTLAESYLYTREAFASYLQHLSTGGVLTLTRWMADPPRQTLRVITIADAALRELGIRDPASHIMLFTDTRRAFSVFWISKTPFSAEQTREALALARQRDFIPLALPGQRFAEPPNLYEALLATPNMNDFVRNYPFDISVTTDDRPFFFEHTRWQNAWKYPDRILDRFNGHAILLATTLIVAALGALFILTPAGVRLRSEPLAGDDPRVLGYFVCLGVGYVLVEMTLVQKLTLFLGHPVYALAVVLCGMLMFSGLGSSLSARWHVSPAPVALGVAVALLSYRFGLDAFLHAALGFGTVARIALALLLLSLPCTLMGMPFPSALSALGEQRSGLWVRGWVVNGYGSVLGSCLAMIASISFGLRAVLVCGAMLYALASVLWSARAVSRNRTNR